MVPSITAENAAESGGAAPGVCRFIMCIHNVYACAPLIDGLGYATSTTTVPFSCSRTRAFQKNRPHYFSSQFCDKAVGIAQKPLGSL